MNAGRRKEVRRKEKEQAEAEQARLVLVSQIMGTDTGRRWLVEKLEDCGIFATSFSTEALQMAFLEGKRDVGLRLLADIMDACPEQYTVMMREHHARRTEQPATDDSGDPVDSAADRDAFDPGEPFGRRNTGTGD